MAIYDYNVNGESFAGLNFRGFDPMKYFAEILSRFIGQKLARGPTPTKILYEISKSQISE